MTLTRQRNLLLLFALAARELTFGQSQDGAWHPGVPPYSQNPFSPRRPWRGAAQARGLMLEGEKGDRNK